MPVEQMGAASMNSPSRKQSQCKSREDDETRRSSLLSSSSCASSEEDGTSVASTGCLASTCPSGVSAADYDHIRNTTLMFFLDRLYMSDKKGAEVRTLHDLSCLFGTRGFTKEMRQIVGASRNGLKKFLQSYPSLFTVDGDQVSLTQLEQNGSGAGGSTQRDYNKEAVEYFAGKLAQFGASLVPIKNLFGYRSQASQEVRHVSGRTSREFKQFLLSQPQAFEILAGEHVVLRSALQELESLGETTQSLEQTLQPQGDELIAMDSYLNKQFAQSVCESLGRMQQEGASSCAGTVDDHKPEPRVRLEKLHERIMKECSNQLFIKMVKTTDDLKLFLRMHPKLFRRFTEEAPSDSSSAQVEYVRLVNESERSEMEKLSHPSMQYQQQQQVSPCRQEPSECYTSLPANLNQPHHSPRPTTTTNAARTINNNCKPISTPQAAPVGQPPLQQVPSTTTSGQRLKQEAPNAGSNLRANAPAFVPATRLHRHNPVGSGSSRRGSLRLANDRAPTGGVRAALHDHLVKAQASNQSNGIYSLRKMSNGAAASVAPLVRQHSSLVGQELRARTIDIVREASKIISLVMNNTDKVAFDCEGYNLGFNNSHGQITLIQLAFLLKKPASGADKENNNNKFTEEDLLSGKLRPEMCVFDLLTNPELAYCLKPLLESEQIEKIMHDVRNKSNALYQQFGVMLNRVFDTQVANLVIQQQETGKPAYKSHYISMSKLCELYGSEWLLKHRNSIRGKTRHSSHLAGCTNGAPAGSQQTVAGQSAKRNKDVDYWRNRPLTDAMVYEASMDVYCLMGGVYQNLKSKIKPEYMPLFQELNREGVLARIRPDEIRTVKKERKIDLEVIDLKRKLYSDSLRSIVLSNREIRLLRHVDLTEEVRQKIQQCKKVAKKLERLDMKAAQQQQQQEVGTLQGQNSGTGSEASNSLSEQQLSIEGSKSNHKSTTASQEALNDIAYDATAGLGNLMESSMFDELKDKMIESSSLLESLEDDDDLALGNPTINKHYHHQHSDHNHSSELHTSCNCQCHHSLESQQEPTTTTTTTNTTTTNDINEPKPPENKAEEEENNSSLISTFSSLKEADTIQATEQSTITEPKAVDMAVQCDLLS